MSETKTCLPVRLPGYVSYRGKSLASDERVGIVVLVKNYLSEFVCDFDGSIGEYGYNLVMWRSAVWVLLYPSK